MTSRHERRQIRSKKSENPKQKKWMLWGGAAIVIVAVAAVVFSALSSDDGGSVDASALVSGGSYIGDPNAPVTLVEFGDFQ